MLPMYLVHGVKHMTDPITQITDALLYKYSAYHCTAGILFTVYFIWLLISMIIR